MSLTALNHPNVISAVYDARAVGFKRPKAIRFASGILSPGAYNDNRKIPSHPSSYEIVVTAFDRILQSMQGQFDVIASVATGGIAFGSVLAWKNSIPHVIVKKKEKDHGLSGLVDGDDTVLPGRRVVLVEDMSTTFESALRAMKPLEEKGATVVQTLMVSTWNFSDFQENVQGHFATALCTGDQLFEKALAAGDIDPDHERIIRKWLKNPHDESWAQDGTWIFPETDNK